MNKLNKAMKLKSSNTVIATIKLGILAGIYISFGSLIYSIMLTVDGNANLIKLLGAILFSIGLNFVVFFKAQLFTGNNLMIFSLFTKELNLKKVLRNWLLVYIGNFFGAILFSSFIYFFIKFIPGLTTKLISIASTKVSYDFNTAFLKALYCNFLVCLAIYFGITFEKKINKVIGIIIPITAFVYFGFEHSIANMFFIPLGLFSSPVFGTQIPIQFLENIVPVTLGNIFGGTLFSLTVFFVFTIKKYK